MELSTNVTATEHKSRSLQPPPMAPPPPPPPQDIHTPQESVAATQPMVLPKDVVSESLAQAGATVAGSVVGLIGGANLAMWEAFKQIAEEPPDKKVVHSKILIQDDPITDFEDFHKIENYLVFDPSSKYKDLDLKKLKANDFATPYQLNELHTVDKSGSTPISFGVYPIPYSGVPSDPPPPIDSADWLRTGVRNEFDRIGLSPIQYSRVRYQVATQLVPFLRKLQLDPVQFFTARACWQGVSCKRRGVLGAVLSKFADLPKGHKTWQEAVQQARHDGVDFLDKTDEYFIRYFFDNRKALKALFRASLANWKGDRITCYRGRSVGVQENDRLPLECYSLSPATANLWATNDNLKVHRVKLGHVWSLFTVTQNNNHGEQELTIFSRGGKRKGKLIKDVAAEAREADKRFRQTSFTKVSI